jgi:hypothetical protein
MKRDLLVTVDCGDETCRPCAIRDTRMIGVARRQPHCLAFGKRLQRQAQNTKVETGEVLRLTIRCAECLAAERRARGKR